MFIAYIKVGDVLMRTGRTGEALEGYRKALMIRAAMVEADPLNASARRELANSYDKVGNALAARGETYEALENYNTALKIREALAVADPTNAEVGRDLASSCYQLGKTEMTSASDTKMPPKRRKESWNEARVWFQRSLTLYLDLKNKGALNVDNIGQPEKIAGEIKKCDVILARLAR